MSDFVKATGVATFEQDVLETSRQIPVIVDFWAAWCGPCQTLGPILEKVARSLDGKARVLKVDTDAEQQLAGQFQIRSIPTVLLFREGRLAAQFVGVRPEQAIRDWVKPFLPLASADLRAKAATARARGETDAARNLLMQALTVEPADHDCREDLAELELATGNATAAREQLALLPDGRQLGERAKRISARLYFADELANVDQGTADLDQLYAEGLKSAAAGTMSRAAEAFLTLAQRSRAYREDAGRMSLLRLFDVLGPADPIVQDYRRRLAQLLH